MKASTAFNRKNNGVNSVQPEKKRCERRATGKIAAFAAFNPKNGGVNVVELEK